MSENINLNSLKGKHFLSGVDFGIHKWGDKYREDSNTMLFILDDITYEAIEDPSDGYRSCLDSLKITNKKVKNTFLKHEVLCRKKKKDEYAKHNTLEFIDIITGEVVLEVGTNNYDDWYPYCIMGWYPENLAINARGKRNEN